MDGSVLSNGTQFQELLILVTRFPGKTGLFLCMKLQEMEF